MGPKQTWPLYHPLTPPEPNILKNGEFLSEYLCLSFVCEPSHCGPCTAHHGNCHRCRRCVSPSGRLPCPLGADLQTPLSVLSAHFLPARARELRSACPQALWPRPPPQREPARCLGHDFCERFLNLQPADNGLLGNHYSEAWGREDLCVSRLLPAPIHWLPGKKSTFLQRAHRASGRWGVWCWLGALGAWEPVLFLPAPSTPRTLFPLGPAPPLTPQPFRMSSPLSELCNPSGPSQTKHQSYLPPTSIGYCPMSEGPALFVGSGSRNVVTPLTLRFHRQGPC